MLATMYPPVSPSVPGGSTAQSAAAATPSTPAAPTVFDALPGTLIPSLSKLQQGFAPSHEALESWLGG